jgi:HK97 gp10 family phage protein
MAKTLKASVAVEGLHAIERLLDQIGKTAASKIIRKALRDGSKSILNTTRGLAPVDTGLMKKSLGIIALKRKRGRIGFRVGFKNVDQLVTYSKNKKKDKSGKEVNQRYFYPSAVEYGTKKNPPHPFMRPAYEQNKEYALRDIRETLRIELEKYIVANAKL